MCQLFAASFNEKLNITYSFRGFRTRGEGNPHGWGLAWYPHSAVQIMKEPIKAGKSDLADFLQNYQEVRSKIFIGHVRRRSAGGTNYSNTHPFGREYEGVDYSFAHNGTVSTDNLLKDYFKPVGSTDSERAFCHLMNKIKGENISRLSESHFGQIRNILVDINREGNFNCIFSDGNYLFCYHDYNSYNGLCYLKREAPFQRTRYLDEDIEVDFSAHKDPGQKGFVVATSPLTHETWTNFEGGELIVFKDGEKVYSSSNITQVQSKINDSDIVILDHIREQPNRISIQAISKNLKISTRVVKKSIKILKADGWIRQDSRDIGPWDSDYATYYTHRNKREEIDALVSKPIVEKPKKVELRKNGCYYCGAQINTISHNCLNCRAPEKITRAKQLSKLWGVICFDQKYHKDGDWYHVLNDFPGALFDRDGFVLFDTQAEFDRCKHLSIHYDTNSVHVIGYEPREIKKIENYTRMIFENGKWAIKK